MGDRIADSQLAFTGSMLHVINVNNGALFPVGGVANAAPLRGFAVAP